MSNHKRPDDDAVAVTHPSLDERTQELRSLRTLAAALRADDDDDGLDDDAFDGVPAGADDDARGARLSAWAHAMADRAEAHLASGGAPRDLSRVLMVPPVELDDDAVVPVEQLDTARIVRMDRAQLELTVVRVRSQLGSDVPSLHALSDEQVQDIVRGDLRDLRTPSCVLGPLGGPRVRAAAAHSLPRHALPGSSARTAATLATLSAHAESP